MSSLDFRFILRHGFLEHAAHIPKRKGGSYVFAGTDGYFQFRDDIAAERKKGLVALAQMGNPNIRRVGCTCGAAIEFEMVES